MTSQRKITANRSNAQKSSGPRTAEGKRTASGNSRKHGWAAVERCRPAASAEADALARAICGSEENSALLVQARTIAENQLVCSAIRMRKLGAVELLLAEARMSDDEFFQRTIDRLLDAIFTRFKGYLPPLATLRQRYSSEDIAERIEEYFDGEDLIRFRKFVKRFLDRQPNKPAARDEYQAFELAAADLKKLERYETRAWSRQMRAIRSFIEFSRNS